CHFNYTFGLFFPMARVISSAQMIRAARLLLAYRKAIPSPLLLTTRNAVELYPIKFSPIPPSITGGFLIYWY
ncbi:hypothetical protein, partial [Pseudomonas sp. FEN]